MPSVVITFDNDEAAKNFIVFLSEAGEQYYWDFMDAVEERSGSANITATWFRYPPYNENGYSPDSLGNYLVRTKLGRLDNKEVEGATAATVCVVLRRPIDEWEIVGVYDTKEKALSFCLEKFYTDDEAQLARLDKPVVLKEYSVGQ